MAFVLPVNGGDLIQASTINGLANGSVFYSPDIGVSNSCKVTFDGVTGNNKNRISALTDGLVITFQAAATNTGASTLEIMGPAGSLGLKSIVRGNSTPLAPSDIRTGQAVTVVYLAGAGRFQLITSPVGIGYGAVTAVTADTPLTNMTWTTLPFGTLTYDSGGYWNTGSNTVLTIPTGLDGLYLVILTVDFAFNATGLRYCSIALNGSNTSDRTVTIPPVGSLTDVFIVMPLVLRLYAGDTIGGVAWQSSGASLSVRGAGGTRMALVRLSS